MQDLHRPRGRIARLASTLPLLLPLAWLSGCGGGDAGPGPTQAAATAATTEATIQAATDAASARRHPMPRLRSGLVALAASPADGTVAVADADGTVRLLDAQDGQVRRQLSGPSPGQPAGLAFVQQGRRVVAVGRDSEARVWDAGTGDAVARLRGPEQPLRAVASSADGRVLAIGGEDARVLVWNAETGKLQRVLMGSDDVVDALALSPDGQWLAAGNAHGTLVVWHVADGRRVAVRAAAHAGDVDAVAFSPSGDALATAGRDGRVLLWSTASLQRPRVLASGATGWRALAFSGDGRLLAAGDARGQVAVWDLGAAAASGAGNAAALAPARTVVLDASPVNAMVFPSRADATLVVAHESRRLLRLDATNGVAR